jgi:hypothetical protein
MLAANFSCNFLAALLKFRFENTASTMRQNCPSLLNRPIAQAFFGTGQQMRRMLDTSRADKHLIKAVAFFVFGEGAMRGVRLLLNRIEFP